MANKYIMYIRLPDGSSYVVNIYPNDIQTINIKIHKGDMVIKEVIIPITFDGNNRTQCLNIKLDSLI